MWNRWGVEEVHDPSNKHCLLYFWWSMNTFYWCNKHVYACHFLWYHPIAMQDLLQGWGSINSLVSVLSVGCYICFLPFKQPEIWPKEAQSISNYAQILSDFFFFCNNCILSLSGTDMSYMYILHVHHDNVILATVPHYFASVIFFY